VACRAKIAAASAFLFLRVCLVSAPIGKLVGSRRKLRLRSDLQLFHDALTLSCNEAGAAAKLSGDLVVCFSFGEAPQQLLLLRRQLFAVRRWYLLLQVGPPIRSNRDSGEITHFAERINLTQRRAATHTRADEPWSAPSGAVRPSPAAACRRRDVVMAR
jgi:hypothetical protein